MAITQLGLHGPQRAYGTFSPKSAGAAAPSLLPMMGVGSWLLWLLVRSVS